MMKTKNKTTYSHNYFVSEETIRKLKTGCYEVFKIVGNEILVRPITKQKGKIW